MTTEETDHRYDFASCQTKETMVSIVIPIYNSSEIFPELFKRLTYTFSSLKIKYEIIAVVDGCSDDSTSVIEKYCRQDSRLKLIEFSRNFGHQAAITAGLENICGEMIIIMDDDLEDPPEILPKFIEKSQEGYDVVYGIRKKRKASLFRRVYYHIFYRLLHKLSDVDMPSDSGDFCLMRRQVVNELNSMPETNRYLRGMRRWVGFSQTGVEYERGTRFKGKSGYSLTKYIKFAFNAIFSFSYKPLHYVTAFGFLMSSISFLLGVRLIILKILNKVPDVPGWVSLMVAVLFIGGVQLISIGILGQYLARIFDEVKQRPKYIIKRKTGFN
jgi:dolichol-phosphate mannosyltransferase